MTEYVYLKKKLSLFKEEFIIFKFKLFLRLIFALILSLIKCESAKDLVLMCLYEEKFVIFSIISLKIGRCGIVKS